MRYQTALVAALSSAALAQQDSAAAPPSVSVPDVTDVVPTITSTPSLGDLTQIQSILPTVSEQIANVTSSAGQVISSIISSANDTIHNSTALSTSKTTLQVTTTDGQGNTITTDITSTAVVKPTGGSQTTTGAGAGGTGAAAAIGANKVLGGLLGAAGLLAAAL